ncbi:glycerol-3-phosphate dehydrogenase [Polystyrenella longa]|uniref:Glycerol-3-phosphate dehydrogenase n=1 Tax=Polystyrenella longa TaxID=2528007 RepID=A0A518CHY1_9PLAN|nr:FAD-dependent oxidoreductase [Polystyrenella longa]QDU78839.1 glycerol-3-phosphate dehydrogenase [Polystyrenella longa]
MEARTRDNSTEVLPVQVVLFGGGIAGLWLLDQLVERGYSAVLLESQALGSGQTIASQGIIHGGLKYTLQGMLTRSAAQIREMPGIWKACLAGERTPDLSETPLRSDSCYLWRTESLRSRLGMIGAQVGLRVAPTSLCETERPEVLKECPGTLARLEEQVLSPAGLLQNFLKNHRDCLLKIDAQDGVKFNLTPKGTLEQIQIHSSECSRTLSLQPEQVVFTAGKGNIPLREQCGLSTTVGQARPLHMVVVRGDLPWLNGHCVDGAKTRVTISSEQTSSGQTAWQLGGQIAELGVNMPREELLAFAADELSSAIPGISLSATEWSSYRVDRAEPVTPEGKRPEQAYFLHEQNIWTAWPTKLALAPQLSEHLLEDLIPLLSSPIANTASLQKTIATWPRPDVALPPWEQETEWSDFSQLSQTSAKHVA